MRTLLLAGAVAVAGLVAPESAQVAIDTPIEGVRVGPQPYYYRHYEHPRLSLLPTFSDDGLVRRIRCCD
jgi:hypothetical protein